MPQETKSESRTRLKQLEDEELSRKREINARLRQKAVDEQNARRNAPKTPVADAPDASPTPSPALAPESSEEEEFKKNRPQYFKK